MKRAWLVGVAALALAGPMTVTSADAQSRLAVAAATEDSRLTAISVMRAEVVRVNEWQVWRSKVLAVSDRLWVGGASMATDCFSSATSKCLTSTELSSPYWRRLPTSAVASNDCGSVAACYVVLNS